MKNITGPSRKYSVIQFSETKLCIGKLNGNGSTFTHFYESVLPQGLISAGEVRDIPLLTQHIIAAKKQSKLTDKMVVVGVPETKATTHSMKLPALTDEEIEQAIYREANTFLPFSVQDEYMDWMVINKLPDGNQVVLISAIPKNVIDGFAQAVEGAGLSPVAFESTSITLFHLLPHTKRDNTLAAEIGELNTVVILTLNGTIEAVSVIPGNENILEKLSKMLQFFVEEKTEGKMPDELFITGKNATPAFAAQLNTQLKMKISFLHAKLQKFPEPKQIEYAVLYSLAGKPVGLPDDSKTINVLPTNLIAKYEDMSRKKLEKMLKGIVITALISFITITIQSLLSIMDAKQAIERRTVTVSKSAQSTSIAYSPGKINVLGVIATVQDKLRLSFDAIYNTAPEGVSITGVQYEAERGTILVAGTALSREVLLSYKKALEDSKIFEDVTVPLSSLEKNVDVEYRIIVTISKPKPVAGQNMPKQAK